VEFEIPPVVPVWRLPVEFPACIPSYAPVPVVPVPRAPKFLEPSKSLSTLGSNLFAMFD